MNFSFHTIELKKTITTIDYSRAHYFLKRHKSRYYPITENEDIWQSDIFEGFGVRTYIRHMDGKYPYSEIKFIVNPRLLLGDKDYIGIFEPTKENIQDFIIKMNRCLKKIMLNKLTEYHCSEALIVDSSINDFTVSRIDLCFNYLFPTQAIAEVYLKLMKRGQKFRFLDDTTYYDKTAKRQMKYENAVVLEADSFAISIYSKMAQMLDQIDFYKEIPHQAEGLLRFEIQLDQSKIKRIWKNNLCESLYDFLEQIPDISFSEFRRYLKGLFLKGDYMLLHEAKKRVMMFYPKHAQEIIDFLQLVSKFRSLDKVIAEYETNGLRYDKIMRKLDNIDINPVTLPEEDSRLIEYSLLPSIPLVLGLLKNG